MIAGVVSTGHLLYHVVSHSPQCQGAVPGAGHQELIVQPGLDHIIIKSATSTLLPLTTYLVKNPVRVGIFSDTDGVEGWKTIDGHIVAVPGAGGEEGPAGVHLDAVDAALLVWRVAVLTAGQAGDLVQVLRVDVQHHQLVALGSENDLFVAEPLTAEDLVGVGLRDLVLLHHGIAQHVAGGVLRGQSHGLQPPVAAQLPVVDALDKVAGDAVAGVLTASLVWRENN